WGSAWQAAWQPPNRRPLLLCLIGAALLLIGGRGTLARLWQRIALRFLPDGRLRRSATAAVMALVTMLVLGLVAQLVHQAVNWGDALDDDLDAMASGAVRVVSFAALMAGLGSAMLAAKHPSWRLLPLADDAARRLRRYPWYLGGAALLVGGTERIVRSIGWSLPATVLLHALLALLVSGLIGTLLLRLRHARHRREAESGADVHRSIWVGAASVAATLGVATCWVAVFTGFIALAFFIAVQMLWIGLIAAGVYLLAELVRDVFEALLSPHGRSGQRLQASFDLDAQALAQAAMVLTGVTRVLLALAALALVLAPFDASPSQLAQPTLQRFSGLKLGQLTIEPGTVLSAIAVFVVGLVLLRMFKRWLGDSLLPTTHMDAGMRESVVTLLGYLGAVLVFALALAALNVSLQSIAWIASALSVGIGFGLQAIVQNFISGLILLMERPVKVGDWVSLSSDVEGDIRRINVRATEIQLWDRSTVIVPNSQLITQNVRNVTLGGALGRVRFLLPLPLDTDPERVRTIMLDALTSHPATLATPAPVVRLSKVETSAMSFVATAYVRSPREADSAQSDILFDVLARLRAANLPLSSSQSLVVRTVGNPPPVAPAPAG
ncbi:MAG TPA: mechanosensitive ion channel domain-containing protein, partial [Rhodanobacter sp.]|nr:mechanosensitive ion channel domain-containing protein [Rhodanobacter sp.]